MRSYVDRMPPKRNSASAALASDVPSMNQADIRQLVVDSVVAALEAQAANMTNADNTNRNPEPREAPVARKIEEAYKITWVEFKKLLIKTYCPRTEELATLCPTMVSDSEKMMEAFIGILPQSIERNVIASKPQMIEEAINIAQRLMDQRLIDQVTKYNSVQGTNDHKRKFDDSKNTDNNNYPNDRNNNNHSNNCNNNYQDNRNNYNRNNDYHQHQNRRQETLRTYDATSIENKRSSDQGLQKLRITISKPSLHHPTESRDEISIKCRKTTKYNSQGRAYMLRDRNAHRDPNVVTGATPGIKSIRNYTWRTGGKPGRSSGKTSGNSLTTGAKGRESIFDAVVGD
nr:hypothetical protein [Tanacetum cinerariifolium]